MNVSPELQAIITRNGWRIIDDKIPAKLDKFLEKGELPAVDHVLTVQRDNETPTRIVIGKPSRALNMLAADMRSLLNAEEGTNLIICYPDPVPSHEKWILEYQINFAMRYARGEDESEKEFWDRLLFPVKPIPVEPFMSNAPMPQFLPGQNLDARVIILTGWNKSTICNSLYGSVSVMDGVVDGLHMSEAARKLRSLAIHVSCIDLPLVISVRDNGVSRYTKQLFEASGVRVAMYVIMPTKDGISATMQ